MKSIKARDTSPVRIRPTDKRYIRQVARETKLTQAEVLHQAVELLRRKRQFQEIAETYSALTKEELAEIHAESSALDTASSDGIE